MRVAGPGDAGEIGRLLHDFNAEYDSQPNPEPEVIAGHVERLLAAEEMTALLAEDGPHGIAVLRFRTSLYTGRPDAYLEELYVVPARRGRGLGRALLDAAMDAARSHGATHFELTTSEGDGAARGLYESTGFTNREGAPDGPVMLYYEREL